SFSRDWSSDVCSSDLLGRAIGFSMQDRITLLFCGSKKSLSSGVPIANILFASHAVGAIVLPVMVFHQIQLIVCAVIAGIYARRQIGRASCRECVEVWE